MMIETSLQESLSGYKNKIAIQKIYPAVPKNELIINNNNSILGVSINSPTIRGNKILAIFDFLHKQVGLSEINLIIGDSIYRYTAMINLGINEVEAKNIGLAQGKNLIEYYQSYVKNRNTPYKLNYFLASEIEKENAFGDIHTKIFELFNANSEFRLLVDNFASHYCSRVVDASSIADTNVINQYAHKYLIAELAILAILNQQGMNTLIYPGNIQAIYNIITLDQSYLADLFKNYVCVALRIKRR